MANPPITELLRAWSAGDSNARDRLIPLVYKELRRRAMLALRKESAGQSIQATALVHEAYLRLIAQKMPAWQDRKHFYAIAARLMREILVDHARSRRAAKRGSGARILDLDSGLDVSNVRPAALVALDDALNDFAALDAGKCELVELHFFGGLTLEEIARERNTSVTTVKRHWSLARAWLHRHMKGQLEPVTDRE